MRFGRLSAQRIDIRVYGTNFSLQKSSTAVHLVPLALPAASDLAELGNSMQCQTMCSRIAIAITWSIAALSVPAAHVFVPSAHVFERLHMCSTVSHVGFGSAAAFSHKPLDSLEQACSRWYGMR